MASISPCFTSGVSDFLRNSRIAEQVVTTSICFVATRLPPVEERLTAQWVFSIIEESSVLVDVELTERVPVVRGVDITVDTDEVVGLQVVDDWFDLLDRVISTLDVDGVDDCALSLVDLVRRRSQHIQASNNVRDVLGGYNNAFNVFETVTRAHGPAHRLATVEVHHCARFDEIGDHVVDAIRLRPRALKDGLEHVPNILFEVIATIREYTRLGALRLSSSMCACKRSVPSSNE